MSSGRRRGSSYLELLAAIALIGFAIVASSTLLLRSRRLADRMENRAIAAEAVASELARLRAVPAGDLSVGRHSWMGAADRASGLPRAAGSIEVSTFPDPPLRRVHIELTWGNGERYVGETLLPEARR